MDFLIYQNIVQLLVAMQIVIVLIFFKRNVPLVTYVVLFSIMVVSQSLSLGREIYAWQIAAMLWLFNYLGAGRSDIADLRPCKAVSYINTYVVFYFLYTLLAAIIFWVFFATLDSGDGIEASVSRIFTQMVYFIFIIGIYGMGMRSSRYLTSYQLSSFLILVAVAAAYLGLLQLLVYKIAGFNIFPILLGGSAREFSYIRDLTFRVTSFAGEPKHLGLLLALGITFYFVGYYYHLHLNKRFSRLSLAVMIIALILSISTTGIVLTAVGISLSTLMMYRRMHLRQYILIVSAVVTVSIFYLYQNEDFLSATELQLSKNDVEAQDASVRDALLNNPEFMVTGTGLGNIHIIAVDYLPSDFTLFREGGYKGNTGFFYVLGDTGLIGFGLLLGVAIIYLRLYSQKMRLFSEVYRPEASFTLVLGFVIFALFVMRYNVFFFFFAGFSFGRLAILSDLTRRTRNGRDITSTQN